MNNKSQLTFCFRRVFREQCIRCGTASVLILGKRAAEQQWRLLKAWDGAEWADQVWRSDAAERRR